MTRSTNPDAARRPRPRMARSAAGATAGAAAGAPVGSVAGSVATAFAALLMVACGGPAADTSADNTGTAESGAAEVIVLDPAVACRDVQPEPVVMAVLNFIDEAEPKPLRFLNAVSTDSALPAAAEIAVQDKGPTFYWLASEKNQQQIRDKLERGGDWANMLVLVRQNDDQGDGTHVVRVGGRYIGAPHEGLESAEKRYTVSCQVDSTAVWAITNVTGGGAK